MSATQLAALEARVAQLEATVAAGADSLTPNAFYINSEGQLEEKLTGKLEARGIIFDESALLEAISIVWEKTHARVVSMPIEIDIEGGHIEYINALVLEAEELRLEGKVALRGPRERETVLFDAEGRPAFPVLPTALHGAQMAAGIATLTWPGGSPYSERLTVKPGLAAGPSGNAVYLLTPVLRGSDTAQLWFPFNVEPTDVEAHIEAYCPNASPAAGTSLCHWLAINY